MLCDVPFFRHSLKGYRGFCDLSVFRYSLNGGLWVMSQFCTITKNVCLPNFSKAQRSRCLKKAAQGLFHPKNLKMDPFFKSLGCGLALGHYHLALPDRDQ